MSCTIPCLTTTKFVFKVYNITIFIHLKYFNLFKLIEQIQFTLKDVSPKLIKNAHILQSSQFDQFYDFNIQIIGIFFIIEQKDETSHLAKSLLYAAMNEEDNQCSSIFLFFRWGLNIHLFQ